MNGQMQKPLTFEAHGFEFTVYRSPRDGAVVVQMDGAPADDPDCENVRVYMNEGFASKWTPG